MDFAINYILIPLIKIALILAVLPLLVAALTLAERKVIAFMQVRLGPMRVGPWGLLQPIADPIKLLLKEDIIPERADRWIFTLAPIICLIPAFIVLAVIPIGPTITIFGKPISLYVTDLNIGVLYVLSISSVGVLGIILGGWASNSKYPLLGALRSAAQMVSYEVALGFSIMGVLMLAGSLSLVNIVEAQKNAHFWYVFLQPIGFILFFICGVAETNRAPFDLPEAESELVAGFHTEYSGFRFSLFFLAEYANMITVSAMAVTLFWGGWLRPFPNVSALAFLDVIPSVLWFAAKVIVFLYFYLWFRASWPRYRYDQLMKLGWQFLLPLSMANVIVTAILVLVLGKG
ncbi:MAG: NADH-quinone oxidoreductase subunit NuoH [Acidobacteria bacterium]|nr:MAG: NADH-quinone oxidoreductase subunit NuoH [Acidobacteriota bacterium]